MSDPAHAAPPNSLLSTPHLTLSAPAALVPGLSLDT